MSNQLEGNNTASAALNGFNQSHGESGQQQQYQEQGQSQQSQGQQTQGQASSGGDALDKGIETIAAKLGHPIKDKAQIEKISDGIRSVFKKVTGKDVPVKDQEYK